jgi:phosphoribosylglycinamide formyltransferase-1
VRDAINAGASVTGATVHIVDAGVDTGPVLVQREVAVASGISESDLHEQIKAIERALIVEVVSEIAEGKLNLAERAN